MEVVGSVMGSEAWIGADATQPDSVFHERAASFVATVNWDALLSIASHLRSGMPCKISDKFSVGQFNMVRRIIFDDEVSWVARLRMPPVSAVPTDREAASVATVIDIEVAGMKFIRAKTDLPVPAVHTYNTEQHNAVGAPYILMDYIHGTVASELRLAKDCALGRYGTPEQDHNFRREMATIQAVLATFTFDHIGSVYQDLATGEFYIGPDFETNKGPWTRSSDYFADIAQHCLQVCVNNAAPEVLDSASFALPIVFERLMNVFTSDGGSGGDPAAPFCLTNRDLGPHNLLVDEEFRIVGLIDLDGLMAAPIHVAAQFPVLAGLDPEPPGHVETKPFALERIKRTEPLIREYHGMIKEIEQSSQSSSRKLWEVMFSNGARVVQGLNLYKGLQKHANDNWMNAYTRLLVEHYTSNGSSTANVNEGGAGN
ncbi:hypothetical protein BKA67DRAFT_97034 [Truncatella angustata]|uniref:Aminoglycoside phosphotransferase domain-containing protein n=1 Tax=Truncatella angustata TaxID=152316 RepID=A0A9P8RHQ6_9PEZI|nr:uncharacterized protein BKA67DRAFT_97034 [Truncatella angustata]KAH6646233.1 hypothetical protein BKA67DRAFT_97034 [Truncatella angustata]